MLIEARGRKPIRPIAQSRFQPGETLGESAAVTGILDARAGMAHRGAITVEDMPGAREALPEQRVDEIHPDLARRSAFDIARRVHALANAKVQRLMRAMRRPFRHAFAPLPQGQMPRCVTARAILFDPCQIVPPCSRSSRGSGVIDW